MITNVEYDVLSDSSSDPGSSSSSMPTSNTGHGTTQDILLSARTGELGVFVDPDVTRIVQAGLERARVPDVGAYFESDPSSPRALIAHLSSSSSPSPLVTPSSPFAKLHSLISASLSRLSLDCSLDTTFLVKGNRGTGKFTMVSWVGERLGVGIMEVNCYDLLGDTDTKTEATLRVRFDQAANCAPCILVLRKLEALVGTTQPGDGSKGALFVPLVRSKVDVCAFRAGLDIRPEGVYCQPADELENDRIPSDCGRHCDRPEPGPSRDFGVVQTRSWN